MLTVVVYICVQGTVSQSHMVWLNEVRVTHRSATKRRRGNPEAHRNYVSPSIFRILLGAGALQ